MNPSTNLWKILTIAVLCVTLLLLLPFLLGINFSLFGDLFGNKSFEATLLTTLLNALISAVVLVLFGLTGAIFLLKVPSFSIIGKNLGLLIIPITLGNISIAFLCKSIWGDSTFFSMIVQGGQLSKLGFLLILELYQFGLLFVYLFWMQLQTINADRLNFAIATKFSFYQKLKDIYLPHNRNLILLLAAIAFVFVFYEESKIAYLFKVSQGTDSELITNWIARNYQTNLLVSPDYARDQVFGASAFVLLAAITSLIILFLGLYYFIKKSTSIKLYPTNKPTSNISSPLKKLGLFFGFFLGIVAILPLIISLTKVNFSFSFSHLVFTLLMTFVATLASSAAAIFFGIASRLGWKQTLSSFSQKSLPFFVLLFVLLLVPPIVILITGYKWMSLVGYASIPIIYTIWIIGHILLTLPILGSFVLFNHFRISNNELDYLQVYKLSKTEILRYSFFKRFKVEYLLLFIIGYSFIWNEAVLNNLFSDYIPSFVSGMKMLITGRGADYDKAFGFLLCSFTIALLSAAIWRYIIERAHKQLNTKR